MRTPGEKNREGGVFDVQPDGKLGFFEKFFSRFRGTRVLNLRPRLHARHPWLVFGGMVVVVIVAALGSRQLFTRAEVIDFYPSACLGEWEGSENAQGVPDTFGVVGVAFDNSNSAIYPTSFVTTGVDENAHTPISSDQIFCGGFVPTDYETRGNIESAGITFVWQVGLPVEALNEEQVISGTIENGVGDDEIKPQSGGDDTTSTEPTSIPEESPGNSNSTTTSFLSSDYWFALKFWNVDKALAEETSSTDLVSDEVIVEEVNNPTEPEEIGTGEPSAESEVLPQQTVDDNTTIEERTESVSEIILEDGSTTTIIIAPPITAELIPLGTSTENIGDEQTTSPEESQATISEPEVAVEIPVIDNDFLQITYSTDGKDWIILTNVNQDNWKNLTVSLPINDWEDLRNIQIKIEGIQTTLEEIPQVYLDGILVEVHYNLQPVLDGVIGISAIDGEDPVDSAVPGEQTVITLPPEHGPVPVNSDGSFKADEGPVFDLDLDALPLPSPPQPTSSETSALLIRSGRSGHEEGLSLESRRFSAAFFIKNSLNKLFGIPRSFASGGAHWKDFFLKTFRFGASANAQTAAGLGLPTESNPIVAKIFSPDNKETELKPFLLVVNNRLRITLPEPGRDFRPGKYRLKLWILRGGTIFFTESDFNWGVLAVNFNKSIYTLGDQASVGFAVLTNRGHTVCDAEIAMSISYPSGRTSRFNTRNGTISKNSTCGPTTVTNEPDYSASLEVGEVGTYNVSVVAETIEGPRQIVDKFSAENLPIFDVERLGPTRIFPPADYKFTIRVKANEDFEGTIEEIVPRGFSVFTPTFIPITETGSAGSPQGGDETILTWQVNLKAGDVKDLIYFFNAPDISPELYKLGPLTFTGSQTFRESRQWQIASDAAGEIILLWDTGNGAIPDGWTCISCSAGDPFFNVFPRASSTYGSASSSVDTVTHTASSSAVGGGLASNKKDNVGSTVPEDIHTHSIADFTTGSGDIRPLFKTLEFIKAATTTLPNNIIGMFDVDSGSLPGSWVYDSSMENNYLLGGSGNGTGGAAEHSHAIAASSTAAANTIGVAAGPQATIADASHTHGIDDVSTNASNTPPFIGVVFGRITATATLDSNSNGLIAMFDDPGFPTDWTGVSTSGSAYAGNFLVGSSTFGGVGGGTTHQHASHNVSSSVASVTRTAKGSGGAILPHSDSTHTHDPLITYTTETSIPTFRYVILGRFETVVSNNPPTVSNVVLNSATSITLNPNVTTTIIAVASTTDPEGPGDIVSATGTIYRSGVGATCSSDNQNCYQVATCTFKDTTSTVECSADIWYFARATDASSSFPSEVWSADITVHDVADATDTSSTDPGVELNTLLAITVTTSTINYDVVTASSTTGTTNQLATSTNVGNSTTTYSIHASATLVSGSNEIATSSQRWATSTFDMDNIDAVSTQLADGSALADEVSDSLAQPATSTAGTQGTVSFWGLTIPAGTATGSYSGTTVFTSIFQP